MSPVALLMPKSPAYLSQIPNASIVSSAFQHLNVLTSLSCPANRSLSAFRGGALAEVGRGRLDNQIPHHRIPLASAVPRIIPLRPRHPRHAPAGPDRAPLPGRNVQAAQVVRQLPDRHPSDAAPAKALHLGRDPPLLVPGQVEAAEGGDGHQVRPRRAPLVPHAVAGVLEGVAVEVDACRSAPYRDAAALVSPPPPGTAEEHVSLGREADRARVLLQLAAVLLLERAVQAGQGAVEHRLGGLLLAILRRLVSVPQWVGRCRIPGGGDISNGQGTWNPPGT